MSFFNRDDKEEKKDQESFQNGGYASPEEYEGSDMTDYGYSDPSQDDDEHIDLQGKREEIEDALHDIRMILRSDGGDIELVDITDDNIVKVRLLGHCVGCGAAQMTMQGIVESILVDAVPGVQGVEAVM